MNGIFRGASLAVALAAGLALPASAAHANEPLQCYRLVALCTWTHPYGHGRLRLAVGPAHRIDPPARSAQNQTVEDWCLYGRPGFRGGHRRELAHGQTARDLGFDAYSARPGRCY
jgi:hypothetical protein